MTLSRAQLVRAMCEDTVLDHVIDVRRHFGILVAHFRPARTKNGRWVTPVQADGEGFPDIVAVGRQPIIRELKSSTGKPSTKQQMWLDRLGEAGLDVGIWSPEDILSGRIDEEMRSIATRGVRRS